jgi:dihydroneopterin aldolase/2-amino-4-hydroxy-6-hydroxymethyldihydropteridine diphosphokinase/dihydropteroate synthase
LTVSLGSGSRWPSSTGEAQPVLVSLSLDYDLAHAASTDELSNSIDYSSIYSAIAKLSNTHYDSLKDLSDQVLAVASQSTTKVQEITAQVVQVKAPLHSKAVGIQSSRKQRKWTPPDRFFCDDLVCQTIIGVNPQERIEKQTVIFNISVERSEDLMTRFDFRELTRRLYNV